MSTSPPEEINSNHVEATNTIEKDAVVLTSLPDGEGSLNSSDKDGKQAESPEVVEGEREVKGDSVVDPSADHIAGNNDENLVAMKDNGDRQVEGSKEESEDEVDGLIDESRTTDETQPEFKTEISSSSEPAEDSINPPVIVETSDSEPRPNLEPPSESTSFTRPEPEMASSATQSSIMPSSFVRAPTPSSRTSTPPLTSGSSKPKKFSSVNVNQKFLSKAASPVPTTPGVPGTKLGSLGSESLFHTH